MKIACSLFAVAIVVYLTHCTFACNEALCASVVSKCMLTQSCKCELKNCTCCKDCFNCLDKYYAECCSCVEMCPKPNNTDSQLNKKSHVEDLLEHTPELFAALTESCDEAHRWTLYTYPAHAGVSYFKDYHYSTGTASRDESGKIKEDLKDVNCTVAFMSMCMPWEKCKRSCVSMGAISYRWFHDGCCECVGTHCLNYGINDSRCSQCSAPKEGAFKAGDSEGENLVDGGCETESTTLGAAITTEGYTEIKHL